jgi:MEMO1 family protein
MTTTEITRAPAVAGHFYPQDAERLRAWVSQALSEGATAPGGAPPKVLLVPHAGYRYSGALAARAYASLCAVAQTVRKVVLLGPVHRVAIDGLALPGATHLATPLGRIAVDPAAVATLSALPQVTTNPAAHAQEHSLEVHLPFLQVLLPECSVVPLVVGRASAAEVAEVMEALWGGPETVIVVSTDLSHYHPYDQARSIDQDTVQRLLALQPLTSHSQACGATPVNAALICARAHGLQPRLIGQMNSGDTAQGDKSRVVGYLAMGFYPPNRVNAQAVGQTLLAHASHAIAQALGQTTTQPPCPEWLQHTGASFVTLTIQGQLRGCIGTLQARRSLLDDVRANAVAAALRDPRFAPLSAAEWARTRVEVSLLSPAKPLVFASEADAIGQLHRGVDGVILQWRDKRATFLPQVWEQLREPAQFWSRLKLKAGLAADFWSPDVQVSRYTVTHWLAPEPLSPPESAALP